MTPTHDHPQTPASFREVIGLWPATRFFARDAGCSALLVRQWRHRNFIPPQYWPRIVAAATRRGMAQVDADLLARLAAAARGAKPSPKMSPATPGASSGPSLGPARDSGRPR